MTDYLIKAENIILRRGSTTLLENSDFSILRGENILLVGASSSGKSSLVKALAGQLYIGGNIEFNFNTEHSLLSKVILVEQYFTFKDNFGAQDFYYQQRYNSYDAEKTMTIHQAIGYNKSDVFLNELLLILNLFHRINTPLIQLSSGERKKLQLVLALYKTSQLVILDNPFIGLDTESKNNLIMYLAKISKIGVNIILIDDSKIVPEFISSVIKIDNKQLLKLSVTEYCSSLLKTSVKQDMIYFNLLKNPLVDYKYIIKLENINVSYYQKKVLSNLSWSVLTGEKWLLQGVNSAGKSTLLSLINGDHPQAYANQIELFGRLRGSGETIWDIKRQIGYISPELHWNFDKSISCLNAILSGFFDTQGLYHLANNDQKKLAISYLEQLNLCYIAEMPLYQVSSGIQRLMLLIRALVKNPPLFIFDEPCQGLDDEQSQFFVNLLDNLFTYSNHTIIYVSHREDQIPKCVNKYFKLNPIIN